MPMIRTSIQDKETNVGPDLGESEVVQRGREEKCKETERGRNKKLLNCRPVGWGCRFPLIGSTKPGYWLYQAMPSPGRRRHDGMHK